GARVTRTAASGDSDAAALAPRAGPRQGGPRPVHLDGRSRSRRRHAPGPSVGGERFGGRPRRFAPTSSRSPLAPCGALARFGRPLAGGEPAVPEGRCLRAYVPPGHLPP